LTLPAQQSRSVSCCFSCKPCGVAGSRRRSRDVLPQTGTALHVCPVEEFLG